MFQGLDCLNYKLDCILEKLELFVGMGSRIRDRAQETKCQQLKRLAVIKLWMTPRGSSWALILPEGLLKKGSSRSLLNPVFIKPSNTVYQPLVY